MRDIRDCICQLISANFIFYKANSIQYAAIVWNKNVRTIFTKTLFSVSNEISPILVTHFMCTNDKTFLTKLLAAHPKNCTSRKNRLTRMAMAKLFVLHHEIRKRAGITSKKIPCYIHDAASRWCIIENVKIF